MNARKSHKFRPDVLDALEDRWVPAPLMLFTPVVGNFGAPSATSNPYATTGLGIGAFGTGAAVGSTLNFQTPVANGLSSLNTSALTGAITTPSIVNGVGYFGGVGGVGLNNGISPLSSLAINGGAATIPTLRTSDFAGAGYAPTALATQTGLFPTVLEPNSGLAFYGNTGFLPTAVPSTGTGTNFTTTDYTSGVGYLNGSGLSNLNGINAPNIGYSNSTTPVGIFGVNYGPLLNAPLSLNLGTTSLGGTSAFVPATGVGAGYVLNGTGQGMAGPTYGSSPIPVSYVYPSSSFATVPTSGLAQAFTTGTAPLIASGSGPLINQTGTSLSFGSFPFGNFATNTMGTPNATFFPASGF